MHTGNLGALQENTKQFGPLVRLHHGAVTHTAGTVVLQNAAAGVVNKSHAEGEGGEYKSDNMKGTRSASRKIPLNGEHQFTGMLLASALASAGNVGCKIGDKDCVEAFALDTSFPAGNVLFLKIDVQGGELDVLRGANHMISEHRVQCVLRPPQYYCEPLNRFTSGFFL